MEVLFYKCESPLHVGSGDDLGYISMPIQREIHTGFPVIEASGIKGAYRNHCKKFVHNITDNDVKKIFGNDEGKNDDSENGLNQAYAGTIIFHDAKLLFFPVKSKEGLFKWVTCSYAMNRCISDMTFLNNKTDLIQSKRVEAVSEGKFMSFGNTSQEDSIYLEEFRFIKENTMDGDIFNYFKNILGEKYCEMLNRVFIISDSEFKYFVEMNTEVNTRIRIDDNTGTVQKGALFTEEYVPSESVFYTFLGSQEIMGGELKKPKEDLLNLLRDINFIQMGGNKTLGKGLIQVIKGGD